jgi:hypothetical protein
MAHGFAGLRQFKLIQYAQRLHKRVMLLFYLIIVIGEGVLGNLES